jgi:hypothetical protein
LSISQNEAKTTNDFNGPRGFVSDRSLSQPQTMLTVLTLFGDCPALVEAHPAGL